MANPTVRAGVFYWQNRKAAETHKAAIKFMHGRKPCFGAEGGLAFSKGAAMAEITITETIPVGGSTTSGDINKMIAQSDIDAAILIGGKVYDRSGRSPRTRCPTTRSPASAKAR